LIQIVDDDSWRGILIDASLIRRFVGAIPGGVRASEWDDFMSLSAMDSRIDTLRQSTAQSCLISSHPHAATS